MYKTLDGSMGERVSMHKVGHCAYGFFSSDLLSCAYYSWFCFINLSHCVNVHESNACSYFLP